MPRSASYGQSKPLTLLDRVGGAMSRRRIAAVAGARLDGDIADLGCGYSAAVSLPWAGRCRSLTLSDLALDPALARLPKLRSVPGRLPGVLARLRGPYDLMVLNNVLEHLDQPLAVLKTARQRLRPGGLLVVNVPSWSGKAVLELSAFRLGWSTAFEIDDHRAYYDPKDLWPLLVRAGFKPSGIRCYRHKFGLNTFAACLVPRQS